MRMQFIAINDADVPLSVRDRVDLIFEDKSIKTIRYALQYMICLNESIIQTSGRKVIREAAIVDVDKFKDALNNFDCLLKSFVDMELDL